MTKTQGILAGIGALVVVLTLSWIFTGNALALAKVFAPRQEAVRREVFKQSQAYNDGMANELSAIQLQYAKTTDTAAKQLLLSTAYNRFASVDATTLPQDLQSFLARVREYETTPNAKLP